PVPSQGGEPVLPEEEPALLLPEDEEEGPEPEEPEEPELLLSQVWPDPLPPEP
ncbi:MAG: hypothetical protein QOF96_422, partial [Actinomycetota bacterium]|nr:hypothetical protein [Actinomycetota bacterium]